MSLITYVEPVNIGSLFAGIGALIMICTVSYIFYRLYIKICQWYDVIVNKEAKYAILEESFLDKIGESRGIDLNAELIKKNMLTSSKRTSFRKRIESEIYEDMFGSEDATAPKSKSK